MIFAKYGYGTSTSFGHIVVERTLRLDKMQEGSKILHMHLMTYVVLKYKRERYIK